MRKEELTRTEEGKQVVEDRSLPKQLRKMQKLKKKGKNERALERMTIERPQRNKTIYELKCNGTNTTDKEK